MGKYSQRENNRYNPQSEEPFTISRSYIELFVECPRCGGKYKYWKKHKSIF